MLQRGCKLDIETMKIQAQGERDTVVPPSMVGNLLAMLCLWKELGLKVLALSPAA